MRSIWQDVTFGLRLLVSQRRFTVVVAIILALGVGAPTAVFSIVNAALLRPLPYQDPDRLVAITSVLQTPGRPEAPARTVSFDELTAWRTSLTRLSSISGFAYTQIPIRVGNQAFSPVTALLDAQFLPTLGVRLAAGSHFPLGADAAGTAIISHRLFVAAFNADPAAVGRTMLVDGTPHVLLGVLPADFQFPRSDASFFTKPIDLLIPASSVPGFPPSSRQWWGIGRLAPGATAADAEAELERVARTPASPAAKGGTWLPRLAPLAEETTRRARQPLLIVLGISAVLLLIASTNLMNLFFARGVARVREMAIRKAIGGTTARIIRQMLTESLLLAIVGGGAGVLLAAFVIRGLVALSPVHLPLSGIVSIDWRVLGFSLALCVTASLGANLLPALHVGSSSEQAIRGAGMRATASRGVARVQQALCVAQIGLGVALLASAGLLANSLWRLASVEPGFTPDRVIGLNLSLPGDVASDERSSFYARVLDEVRTIPGVEDAGLITFLPPEMRAGVFMGLAIEGVPADASQPPRVVNTLVASGSYFSTMRMPILRGRNIAPADDGDSKPVILVNEALVRRFFAGTDPLGRRIGTGFDALKPVREIVGIVADTHDRGLQAAPIPTVYIPFQQFSLPYTSVALRTASAPELIVPVIRDRLNRLNASVPLTDVETLDRRLTESLREPRFYALIAGVCAVMAVLFVTFGLYGLISYSVSRRTSELGLRMAIGAPRDAILRLVMWQGVRLACAGVALGLALAFLSTRSLQSLLFEVQPLDGLTFAGASVVALVSTLAACLGPAHRASRIEPLTALRHE
jgi:putative ABC transport system permease protein